MKKAVHVIFAFVLVVTMLAGCSNTEYNFNVAAENSTAGDVIEMVFPVDTIADAHTEKQLAFLGSSKLSTTFYANGKKENSRPEAIEFEWNYKGDKAADTEYIINIS